MTRYDGFYCSDSLPTIVCTFDDDICLSYFMLQIKCWQVDWLLLPVSLCCWSTGQYCWQQSFDDWTLLVSSNTSLLLLLLLLVVVVVTLSQWKMEVDEALGQLGIGRWQILHFTIISIACYTTPCFHMLAIIYIGRLAWPKMLAYAWFYVQYIKSCRSQSCYISSLLALDSIMLSALYASPVR